MMKLKVSFLAALVVLTAGYLKARAADAPPTAADAPAKALSPAYRSPGVYVEELPAEVLCDTDEICSKLSRTPCLVAYCDKTVTEPDTGKGVCKLRPKYADKASTSCCKMGFDEVKTKDEFECCRKYVGSKEFEKEELATYESKSIGVKDDVYGSLSRRKTIPSLYRDLFKFIYRTCLNACTPPKPLDCSIFKDETTRTCCAGFKDAPSLAIGMCVRPGECANAINIEAGAGATVNLENFNQCCQYVTNTGGMADTTIEQVCNNIPGGETPATPTTPTTPSGSKAAAAAATCSCAPRETTKGTAFAGTPWDCEFQAPSAEGPSSLSAAASLAVTVEDPFQVVDAGGAMAKTAKLPNTSNKFVVQGPLLTNWRDNPDYAGKVTACTQDAAGGNLACGDCLVATKAQLFGGAGGEGGCSLIREAAAQPASSTCTEVCDGAGNVKDKDAATMDEFRCCSCNRLSCVSGSTANPEFEACIKDNAKCADPCAKYDKEKDPSGRKCCEGGFDETAYPDEFKCCRKYVETYMPGEKSSKEELAEKKIGAYKGYSTLSERAIESPTSRYLDFFRWMYRVCLNDCPDRKPLDCTIFKDDVTRACCGKFAEVPELAIAKCVKAEDCTNAINITAGDGATVNLSNFNQCCQIVTNSGTMTDTTVTQSCRNITAPAAGSSSGATTGSSGSAVTTPSSGSPASGEAASGDGGGCSLIR